jgi:trimethylamine--corrinoid protein Co-methyltransferase
VLEPGRPCIYNLGLAHIFDMKTAVAVTGAPENALFARASAVMGRFYGLPSASWVSTEAMCPDAQAALEKTFGFHTHLESGVTCIWGVGQLESELTFSPAQAVIDDEIIGFVRRYARGMEVDEDSLALDVIRRAGIAGSFLESDHTLARFRTEFFEPRLLFRRRRHDWDEGGRKRLDERAEEVADTLMGEPAAGGLTEDQAAEIERLTDRFLRRLG